MKEWIKFETDENGGKAVLSKRATGYTTMMMITRLLLNLATEEKQPVEMLLEDLKVVYIPLTIKMASGKTAHEEVIDPE